MTFAANLQLSSIFLYQVQNKKSKLNANVIFFPDCIIDTDFCSLFAAYLPQSEPVFDIRL